MSLDYQKIDAGSAEQKIGQPTVIRVQRSGPDATLRFGRGASRPLIAGSVHLNPNREDVYVTPSSNVDLELEYSTEDLQVIPPPTPSEVVRIVDNDGNPIIGTTGAPLPVIITDTNERQMSINAGGAGRIDLLNINGLGISTYSESDVTALSAAPIGRAFFGVSLGRDQNGQGRPYLVQTDGRLVPGRQDWVELGNGSSLASGAVNVDVGTDGYSEVFIYVRNNNALNNYTAKYRGIMPEGAGTEVIPIEEGAAVITAGGGVQGVYLGPGGYNVTDGKVIATVGWVPKQVRVQLQVTAADNDLEAFVLGR